MKEFLEYFIVYWGYFQLLIVLSIGIYLLVIKKKEISFAIKHNKKIFVLLLISFVIGCWLRFYNLNEYVFVYNNDSLEYLIQSFGISAYNKFIMACDPPSYPLLVSLVHRLLGLNYFSQSIINSFFGSLTIILIFIFTQLLFRNYNASLITALFATFSPLHNAASVSGYPTASSIYFSLLFLIFLISAVKYNKFMLYFAAAACLSFTALFLYVELTLLLFALLYIFIIKSFRFIFNYKIIIAFIFFLIFSSPFFLLQSINPSKCESVIDYNLPGNFLCSIAKNYCKLFSPSYLFKNSDKQFSFVNNINGHLPSYLSFIFFGYGQKTNQLVLNYWQEKYISTEFHLVYLTYIIFIAFSLICRKSPRRTRCSFNSEKISDFRACSKYAPHFGAGSFLTYSSKYNISRQVWFLFFMTLLYLIVFSMYMETSHFLILPIIIYGILPLVSIGLVAFCDTYFKNRLGFVLMLLFIIIIISPFFYGDFYNNLDKASYISKGGLNIIQWSKICPAVYDEYKPICNFIITNYMIKKNINEHKLSNTNENRTSLPKNN